MELALGLEAVAKNVCTIQVACLLVADQSPMGEVSKGISKRPVATATFTDVDIPGIHQPSIHKHKDAKCFNCGKIEHLARVCRLENGLRQSRCTLQLQDVNGHLLSKA